jgi:hypothetical protein
MSWLRLQIALEITLLSLCVLSTQAQQSTTNPGATAKYGLPRVVSDHILEWPDGRRFITTLFGVRVVGQLSATTKLPFLILSGRGCTECDADESIYIHSPSDGPMQNEGSQPRFSYPGRLSSYLDGSLLSRSRMFWGRCLADRGPGIIWFQQEKQQDGTWKPSVYSAEIIGDNVKSDFQIPPPPIQTTLGRVKSGACRELRGRNMTSEP